MKSPNTVNSLFKPGLTVIVGVSGGPDSITLLHYLHSQKLQIIVATFNHQLRSDADDDVRFVKAFAEKLGVPFVSSSMDVGAYAKEKSYSIEEAARELRYQFLFSEARKVNAQAVVVGHTSDDQAETVLMHFLRGAGLSGLKGMTPSVILPIFDAHIPLIRPLLGWSRKEIDGYCLENHLAPRIDISNQDVIYFRNKLRHQLIPLLEQYNPNIKQTINKTALALQGDFELLNELVETAWNKSVIHMGNQFVEFNRVEFEAYHPALRRNLFRKACFILAPGIRDIDFDALNRSLIDKSSDLAGGITSLFEGGSIFLSTSIDALPRDLFPQVENPIILEPGCIEIGNGWTINLAELVYNNSEIKFEDDKFIAWLDADKVKDELILSKAVSGARFEPLGMPRQTIKLSDLYINLKVLKRYRKYWPVLYCNEVIAWVPGLRNSERFKISDKTQRFVKIEIKKIPE